MISKIFTFRLLAFLFINICLLSNFSYSQSVHINDLYGRWEVVKVLEGGEDISNSQGMDANRWIKLNSDNTFESDGNPFGQMSGEFTFDEKNSRLLLIRNDSKRGQVAWKVQFKGYDLVLSGLGQGAKFEIYLNSSF